MRPGRAPLPTPIEAKAETTLAAWRRGITKYTDFTWPNSELKGKLRVMTRAETQECIAGAVKRFTELEMNAESMRFAPEFEEENLVQLLFRACRNADDPSLPFASSVEDLRENTTVREQEEVYDLICDSIEATEPNIHALSDDELQAVRDAIKKKASGELRAFGSRKLTAYLLTTECQPET